MTSLVGVVGSGVMGVGIAEISARGGCDVVVVDVNPEALARAENRLAASLAKASSVGGLGAPVEAVHSRVRWTTDLDALSDREFVTEAIRENLEDKLALVARLDRVLPVDSIIATNTSSIPITRIAAASRHPARVVGTHYFNPVPVMPLVEVVPALQTDPVLLDRTHRFCAEVLGKRVIRAKDRSGFVVNALLVPYLLDAIRSLEHGVASGEEIDVGMEAGCGMPMGPLRLCDLIGLDTMLLVAESLHAEYLDPRFAPPGLLRRHVEAGRLGRKNGRGFYDYST